MGSRPFFRCEASLSSSNLASRKRPVTRYSPVKAMSVARGEGGKPVISADAGRDSLPVASAASETRERLRRPAERIERRIGEDATPARLTRWDASRQR